MAQLSDDCFAFGGPMMTVDEAVALIASRLTPVADTETVALSEADGRVLAEDLIAPLPLPPFTNSAVDGYAVHGTDLPAEGEKVFPIAARVQAGMSPGALIEPGHAVRIFTGAPMPEGADTVFMQEDVRLDEAGDVILPAGLKHGANVRPVGEDIAAGSVVLRAGQILRPQDVALVAALGLTEVSVRRRVRVAVFSTGNEIVSPGATRGPAQLFDSNRFMLRAMLARLGCAVTDLGILRDEGEAIARVLAEAATGHDLILTSGGVSTGEADHVKASVESVGSLVFWRVAVKPGRPVAMGVIRGAAFIGLPGNPVASFVTFAHIARPAIRALAGATPETLLAMPLRAAFSYRKKPGRREYVRASLRKGADGTYEAEKFPREGAGLLSSLVDTDGLVELGEEVTDIKPGDVVRFLPYSSLL
ncbi:molybdopterin molybdotransferase MoeA [Pseudaminobacter soli (ex Li et al. 2025)]|uniref:Molybdopterin molybdenumtransferase n=1 Tax=Pseudaminobacter soli (ex Li et al. 2025) TaxID=1295366 RepID=A0A2P7S4I3_9HYPH|nr:gephyrin-like molybdotransferase Glp [Mesorhizobium soli]PSJ57339.1 molybdopterin molybdenumtransferase MoeA [Mesorhizobium soli]